jgi:hypothetical protein
MKDATPHSVDLDSEKVQFLKTMAETYGLPDMGKAIRCLIDYARQNSDKQAEIFDEIRCSDC